MARHEHVALPGATEFNALHTAAERIFSLIDDACCHSFDEVGPLVSVKAELEAIEARVKAALALGYYHDEREG